MRTALSMPILAFARLLCTLVARRDGPPPADASPGRGIVRPDLLQGVAGARRVGLLAVVCCASGCSSLLNAGSAELAGFGGAALADAVTTNAAVATGVGLGVQAAGRAGLQYTQRRVHRAAQDRIAQAAGDLRVGAVAHWQTDHKLSLENDEQGRVTVSRVISMKDLHCKEIVFSVDSVVKGAPHSGFYVAAVCRDGSKWKWASAEPATERWGALQ